MPQMNGKVTTDWRKHSTKAEARCVNKIEFNLLHACQIPSNK